MWKALAYHGGMTRGGQHPSESAQALKSAGLAATRQRVALLEALRQVAQPCSVDTLARMLKGKLNTTTIYRGLDQLVSARLVRRLDLGRNHALYEVADAHHHHLVCRDCGLVEDVTTCVPHGLSAQVLQRSQAFSEVEDHALEFFGVCNSCKK